MASDPIRKNATQKKSKTAASSGSGNRKSTSSTNAARNTKARSGQTKSSSAAKSQNTASQKASASKGSNAGSRRGSGSRSSTAGTRKTSSAGRKASAPVMNEQQQMLNDEVKFWIACGITAFLTMCNFHMCMGLGEAVYMVLHGLFGWPAYVLPFVMLFSYLFMVSNRGNVEAGAKMRLSLSFFVLCCGLVHLVGIKDTQPFSLAYYFTAGQSGINGGLLGGLIGGSLQQLVGTSATVLIIILLMLVHVILLTERSLVRTLQELFADCQQTVQEKGAFLKETFSNLDLFPEDEEEDEYEDEYDDDYAYENRKNTAGAAKSDDLNDFDGNWESENFQQEDQAGENSVWNWSFGKSNTADHGSFLKQKIPFMSGDGDTADTSKEENVQAQWFFENKEEKVFSGKDRENAKTNVTYTLGKPSTASEKEERFGSRSGSARKTTSGTIRTVLGQGRPGGSGTKRVLVEREHRSLEEMGFGELLYGKLEQPVCPVSDFIAYNGLEQEMTAQTFAEEGSSWEAESAEEENQAWNMELPEEKSDFWNMGSAEDGEETDFWTIESSETDGETERTAFVGESDEAERIASAGESDETEQTASEEELEEDSDFWDTESAEEAVVDTSKNAVDVTEHVILPEDGPVFREAVSPDTKSHLPGASGSASTKSRSAISSGSANRTERSAVSPKKEDHSIWKQDSGEGNRGSSGAVTFGGKPKPPEKKPVVKKPYVFPPAALLKRNTAFSSSLNGKHREIQKKLHETLQSFGVRVNMGNISVGPTVTRYELEPEPGVKVSRIVALQDDIKLALAASDIRIEAPIPGKSAIGIEVPNQDNTVVGFRELIDSDVFRNHPSKVAVAVGRDISGQIIVADLAKMPHLLIAGATGSGKSVCINTLIMSIIYKSSPDDVKLVMVDPKVVELSVYNGIPHLLVPVVTDARKAANALRWAVDEMNDRYRKFAEHNVRNLEGYNEQLKKLKASDPSNDEPYLYQMVIIVDELADLMMVAQSEVEEAICRLAQMARAAGIHLVLATQRPSVNVITGLIKANVPSRIAFAVSSGVDSRTIIDMNGAEKLLGKGDMLFYPYGLPKPIRVQGAFISDEEVSRVVSYLHKNNGEVSGQEMMEQMITSATENDTVQAERDEYFEKAARFIIEKDKASIGALQRNFKIGFNRAARIMDQLAAAGVVSEEDSTRPRKVLMNMEELNEVL